MSGSERPSLLGQGAALIVDASVALKWVVQEDGSDAALALRSRDLAAPALLRIETANALRTLAARQAITPNVALELFALLQSAPVTVVDHDDALENRALELAIELGHPVYDCLYLALAERMERALVTADARLQKVVRATSHARRVIGLDAVSL